MKKIFYQTNGKCLHCGKEKASYCEKCYQELITENAKLQANLQKENEQLRTEVNRWRNKIMEKKKAIITEGKIKLKGLKGTDRYLAKLEYTHKENVLEELLKEGE